MILQRIASFTSVFVLSVMSLTVLYTPTASAAVVEWDGGGADNNLTTPENWVGDVAPVNGDSLVFPAVAIGADDCNTPPAVLNNDFDPASFTFEGVSFTGFASIESFCEGAEGDDDTGAVLSGNNLSLSDDLSVSYENRSKLIVEVDVEAQANLNLTNIIASDLALDIGSYTVALESTSINSVSGDGSLVIRDSSDAFQGGGAAGGVACGPESHPSSYPVSGDSSAFSGSLEVLTFIRSTTQAGDLARSASDITLEEGTINFRLEHNEKIELSVPMTFNGGSLQANQTTNVDCEYSSDAKIELTGAVTATSETEVDPRNKVNIVLSGDVTNPDNFVLREGINNPGTFTLPGEEPKTSPQKEVVIDDSANCFNHELWNSNAKTIMNANCSEDIGTNPEFPQQVSGVLGGTGALGSIQLLDGSVIAPGLSPGIITVTNLTMDEGSTYEFELAGTTPGDDHDQIVAEDSVTIDNATLDVAFLDNFVPELDDEFVIILNNGGDAVDGNFAGLEEGSTLEVSGVTFSISYEGGDGNDVVLTVLEVDPDAVPGAPDTGFALAMANPIATLLLTLFASATLLTIARKQLTVK